MAKVSIEIVADDKASGVFTNLRKEGSSAFDKIKSSALDFFKAMVGFEAVKQAFRFLRDTAADILNTAAAFEQTEIMLRRLTGSAEAGKKSFDWIVDFSTKTPFQMEAVQDSFVKLQVAGLDPMSGKLKNLTDAVAAFGGGSQELQRASVAIQQMSGKGVISMEELRQQLGEAIPSAMKIMAREMGMSMTEFIKHVERGEVDAKTGLEAMFRGFEKDFDGAAAGMMNSWTGMVAQLKVEWAKFAKEIMDAGLFETLKGEAQDFMTWLRSQDLKAWAKNISSAVEVVISVFKVVISTVKILSNYSYELGIALAGIAAVKVISGVESLITVFKALEVQIKLSSIAAQGFAITAGYYIGQWLGDKLDKTLYKLTNIDLSGMNAVNEQLKSIADEREYVEQKHAEALARHKQAEEAAKTAVDSLTISEQQRTEALKGLEAVMKNMLDLETKIRQQQEGYADLELSLRQKLMAEDEKYYSTQQRLEQKLQTALSLTGQDKIDALTEYQRAVANSAQEVIDANGNVVVSLEQSVSSALAKISAAQTAVKVEQKNMADALYAEAEAWRTMGLAADEAVYKALQGINDISTRLDELTAQPHVIKMVIQQETVGDTTRYFTTPVDQGPGYQSENSMSGFHPLGAHKDGTDYVPKTGMYMLPQGEAVIPAAQNYKSSITIAPSITIQSSSKDGRQLAREIDTEMADMYTHNRSRLKKVLEGK
ncbi:MAG: hypothetical protein C4560_03135 [Nitrospiraceae bacterium]|nr:MAG: hypothetical protein C4560_03135 [Nitrospiraceae bacterium]